jgi:hypothetical protein
MEEKEDREKEEFCECLEQIDHKIRKYMYNLAIIMGELMQRWEKNNIKRKWQGITEYTILIMKIETY